MLYNVGAMSNPVSTLIDYLRYRKICGDRTVELEPETLQALDAIALGGASSPSEPPTTALPHHRTTAQPHNRTTPPPHHPTTAPTTVDFLFVGEQEGIAANRAAYSETLRKMVLAMGYGKGEAVFTNICRGRTGQTPPTDAEMAAAMPAFREFVAKTNPRGIVILGSTAARGLLGKPDVSSIHGRVFKFDGIPAIPTYHPAYMEKFKAVKPAACRDLCNALKAVGLPVTPALARFQ